MKVLVLYRPNSEFSRPVEEFIRDFKYQHEDYSNRITVVDIDSRDGSATASLYDVMQNPAILALSDDGQLVKAWVGQDLPLMQEVAGYVYSR
ncbi:MAG TPA: hypothetical protein VLG47_00485 [Candidatus Saccharimonadales bacterium]|nr:hypothetical protein [Candidatus Saccharimonadales bacterium]